MRNPLFRPRISPELSEWLRSLKTLGGYSGEDFARAILQMCREASGDHVPEFPFEVSIAIRLKDGSLGAVEIPGPALRVAEERPARKPAASNTIHSVETGASIARRKRYGRKKRTPGAGVPPEAKAS